MAIDEETFYDVSRIAIIPMGFCFPGLDAKGADLPPRGECAPAWRADLFEQLTAPRLILLVGAYAQRWHLGAKCRANLTETVANWRQYVNGDCRYLPLPHPSWRNNAWLKRNPWFEDEVLAYLRKSVAELLRA